MCGFGWLFWFLCVLGEGMDGGSEAGRKMGWDGRECSMTDVLDIAWIAWEGGII